jgi:hypothetical protein
MDAVFAKLKNIWYYYKIHIGIVLAVVAVTVYLGVQSAAAPKADYHVGLISTTPRSETELAMLTDSIALAGEDLNGDGEVLVQLHTYFVDLADDSPNAGVTNHEKVAALDADLIGCLSGFFLMEEPEKLQAVTDSILEEPYLPFSQDLQLCIRKDAPEHYRTLYDTLK